MIHSIKLSQQDALKIALFASGMSQKEDEELAIACINELNLQEE
ncbi:MAG: hypothetical protein H6Q62_383 [Firmicutes bacterium]|nr:hypothetical protein [Bacillota bacterium]